MSNDKLMKKIKKNIYGKPQRIAAVFPAGFGSIALEDVQEILKNPWYPQKYSAQCSLLKNEIRIDDIHMVTVTELLMRSQCLTDVRLILYEGKAFGKTGFENKCKIIDWDFYLDKKMSVKIKVNSVASKAFHESGLKEILKAILKEKINGEHSAETTTIYADIYKDRLTLSISLAGQSLYKRGYRNILSASAPLREDAAACCIKKALQFSRKENDKFFTEFLFVPFSGTGTFVFEYLLLHYRLSPVLFDREYALQKMPLFNTGSFNYLLKKAILVSEESLQIACVDNSEKANASLLQNSENFKKIFLKNQLPVHDDLAATQDDFFSVDIKKLFSADKNMFIPLNPPYGIRLGRQTESVRLYKNIAEKINQIADNVKKNIAGFILCPNEETWIAFSKHLRCVASETYHFTQGGRDIRVFQFFI
jgi:23S rRNA G2445 N2-methylase RlmL